VSGDSYKRGQMEWALWRAFTHLRSAGETPPQVFKTRIKRLLDVDREFKVSVDVEPSSDYAFVPPTDEGTGIDAAYTPVDVFCLALALDLLNVGFKQSEIVFLMRYLREDLARWFPKLLARPSLTDRQARLAKHYPKLPAYQPEGQSAPLADARVFLVLHRVELTEIFAAPPASAQPVFLSPVFCEGLTDLSDTLDKLFPYHRRTVIVLEIAAMAQAVTMFLEQAPVVRRGRPARNRS
jgi:hypothetical protein